MAVSSYFGVGSCVRLEGVLGLGCFVFRVVLSDLGFRAVQGCFGFGVVQGSGWFEGCLGFWVASGLVKGFWVCSGFRVVQRCFGVQ